MCSHESPQPIPPHPRSPFAACFLSLLAPIFFYFISSLFLLVVRLVVRLIPEDALDLARRRGVTRCWLMKPQVHSLSTHWTVQYGTPTPTNNTHQHHLDQASPRLTSPPSPMSHVPCPFRLVDIKRSGIRRLAFALNSGDACNAPLPPATQQLGCLERPGLLQNKASPSPGDLFGTWSQQVSICFPLTTLYFSLLVTARHCSSSFRGKQTRRDIIIQSSYGRSAACKVPTQARGRPSYLCLLKQVSCQGEKQSNRPHKCLRFGKCLLSCSRKCPYPPF